MLERARTGMHLFAPKNFARTSHLAPRTLHLTPYTLHLTVAINLLALSFLGGIN